MRIFIVVALLGTSLGLASGSAAQASGNPNTTGQPSASCQLTGTPSSGPNFPGNTGSSPGSAFNGSAGSVYANPGSQGGMSSGNPKVVAQYDVACVHNQSH
jgi:hypothetical protein